MTIRCVAYPFLFCYDMPIPEHPNKIPEHPNSIPEYIKMKDPNITEVAKLLNITPEWTKKKMKKLGITGYKEGKSTRLKPLDVARLKLEFSQTPEVIGELIPEQTSSDDFGYSGISTEPIVQIVEYEAAQIPTFAPTTFHQADRTVAIAQLQQNCQLLNDRQHNHYSAFEANLISNMAQRGLQVGMEATQAYLSGLDHAAQMVGKQGGSGT